MNKILIIIIILAISISFANDWDCDKLDQKLTKEYNKPHPNYQKITIMEFHDYNKCTVTVPLSGGSW